MQPDGHGRVRLSYRIASRASMGFPAAVPVDDVRYRDHVVRLCRLRRGNRRADRSAQQRRADLQQRGKAVGYGLFNLQERGRLFIGPNDDAYEGMVIGIHSRENDLTVNPLQEKRN